MLYMNPVTPIVPDDVISNGRITAAVTHNINSCIALDNMVIDDLGMVTLYSSEEHELFSVPHIKADLEKAGLKNIELDGELYIHGMDFNDIHSIVSRTTNLHPAHHTMEYHVFDIIDENTDDNPES